VLNEAKAGVSSPELLQVAGVLAQVLASLALPVLILQLIAGAGSP
jgi:hypothetical protein